MRETPSILPLRLEGVGYEAGGRRLLADVHLEVARSARIAVVGPNGAGKSLTLRIAHGLIAPSAGRVAWSGPAASAARAGRGHAMVFQRPVLLRRSARANLTHALALHGVARGERRRRADDALARFGLASLAGAPARVLSGGEQQRLAMARAWALSPELIFLDEPTAPLDPAATRGVEDVIRTFQAEGVATVITTHDLAQARRLAEEIVLMHRGRVVEQGPADCFFTRPQSPEGRAFVAGELLW
ncbi:ATP-binding cassette domain-containing protein [Salinarimonas rosea]|uniref:ATP-binding cassette domain-containing protein n=1 Tax=Salinarimonas rosea TaxID=552063 RepID=UPI000409D7BF|nr:ATP-binding cassette domain-containing protein [Salinarimonas rosea]